MHYKLSTAILCRKIAYFLSKPGVFVSESAMPGVTGRKEGNAAHYHQLETRI
ncbi:MAG: hypothetical protein RQM92_05500 [Candidatus Syntrophopropionicum ammoniitolerans]